MASEEDTFDIDIYGDGIEDVTVGLGPDDADPFEPDQEMQQAEPTHHGSNAPDQKESSKEDAPIDTGEQIGVKRDDSAPKPVNTDGNASGTLDPPKQEPRAQGEQRDGGQLDERAVEPGASVALIISELHWWMNDDDIRGWANQCRCEDELEDITFSEHKVNGKSKGQAYVLFKSPQAATATKKKIESFGDEQQNSKQFIAAFANPFTNPFKTLPKDGPTRNNGTTNPSRPNNFGGAGQGSTNSGFNNNNNINSNNSAGFRGGRGGNFGNSRGGMNTMGGFNRGGYNQTASPGFQGSGMAGFPNNPMANMQSYGGFQNRGSMMSGVRGGPMGMRGGRGGMIGMPMNGMGFGAMGMGMGMNMPQMPNMGMPGQANFPAGPGHFNPSMFNQPQGGASDGGWNPRGAKRPRQE